MNNEIKVKVGQIYYVPKSEKVFDEELRYFMALKKVLRLGGVENLYEVYSFVTKKTFQIMLTQGFLFSVKEI